MSHNFMIGEERKKDSVEEKPFTQWDVKVLIGAISGFMFLGGAIGALQRISKAFISDADKVAFIENWMPWIAVLFFALGWFMAHWIEVVLLKKKTWIAVILFFLVLVFGVALPVYFVFISRNEVLHLFGATPELLVYSGFFLRYSIFRNESLFFFRRN